MTSTRKKPTTTYQKDCHHCGKHFVARSAGAFYCTKQCKRAREKEKRHELKASTERKRMQVPAYVPVAYEILKSAGAMNNHQLQGKLRNRGYQVSKNLADRMDYHGYLLYEDDAGLLYPYEVRANAMAGG